MPAKAAVIFCTVLLLAAGGAAAAEKMPKDPTAAANVRQSDQYEALLRSNPGFRARRMQEECGPIADQQLHEQCVASFAGNPATPARHKGRR